MSCDGADLWDEGHLDPMDGACTRLAGLTDTGHDVRVHAIVVTTDRMEWDVMVDGEHAGDVVLVSSPDP